MFTNDKSNDTTRAYVYSFTDDSSSNNHPKETKK